MATNVLDGINILKLDWFAYPQLSVYDFFPYFCNLSDFFLLIIFYIKDWM